jgi:hypothetical protein
VLGGHHKFRSHPAKAHTSCHNGDHGSGTSDTGSSAPTIKKAFVFRPQQQEAEPARHPQD